MTSESHTTRNRLPRWMELLVVSLVASFAGAQTPMQMPHVGSTAGPVAPPQQNAPGMISPIAPATGGSSAIESTALGNVPKTDVNAGIDKMPETAPGDTINSGFEILIGPGDLIEVSVYGAPDYVKDVRVRSTGEVTLPLAGTVTVGGLTPAQAESAIAKRLSDGDFFTDARVSVMEKETATQGISVLGEVQKPGVYPLPGPRRLFDALSAAGGTTPRAGSTVSLIHRSDSQHPETVAMFYDGKSSGQSNVYVYPGDTVVVSKAGVVYVIGDVHLPGGFVMEGSHMTVLQALAMAQGANTTAALDRAQLIRRQGADSHPAESMLSLKSILSAKSPDVNLRAEDILFVPTSRAKAAGKRTLEAIIQTATGIAIYSRVP